MPEANLGTGSPVKDFVKSFLEQAEDGMQEKGFVTYSEKDAHIKIELNAAEVQEVGGGFKIHVFSLGGKQSDTNSQKMTIFAKKVDEAEEAEKKARIAEAQAKEKDAMLKKKWSDDTGLPLELSK